MSWKRWLPAAALSLGIPAAALWWAERQATQTQRAVRGLEEYDAGLGHATHRADWLGRWIGRRFADRLFPPRRVVVGVTLAGGLAADDHALALIGRVPTVESVFVVGPDNITEEGLAPLRRLSALRDLQLVGCEIDDAGLDQIGHLSELRVLVLTDCDITDAGLRHLTGLKNLERLTLDAPQLSDAGLARLANLTNLRELYLHRWKVTRSGIARLRRALPQCKIFVVSYPTD